MAYKTIHTFANYIDQKILNSSNDVTSLTDDSTINSLISIRSLLSISEAHRLPSLQIVEKSLNQFLDLTEIDSLSTANDTDLQWSIVGLSALTVFQNVVNGLVKDTVPMSQDLFYWDDIISNDPRNVKISLYMVQKFPSEAWQNFIHARKSFHSRLRNFDLAQDLNHGFSIQQNNEAIIDDHQRPSIRSHFLSLLRRFTTAVQDSYTSAVKVRERLKTTVSSPLAALILLYSPFTKARASIKHNRKQLEKLRDSTAHDLGILVSKSFVLNRDPGSDNWKRSIYESVELLHSIVRKGKGENSNAELLIDSSEQIVPSSVTIKLIEVIQTHNQNQTNSKSSRIEWSKPSRTTRYWPAVVAGSIIGIYSARSIVGNWQGIVQWFQQSVVGTLQSFYQNWIIDPLQQIYQTIRHDENAEIALMNKQSLEADMQSLERMVLDFALDGSSENLNSSLSPEQLRIQVQQGDISTVLKAYEQQIQTPVKSLVKGQLIRTLLIQVQKTKVDLEVAVSGIDKMLKSQELVFGIVAALPSFLIVWWSLRTFAGLLRGRSYEITSRPVRDNISATLGSVERLLSSSGADEDIHPEAEYVKYTNLGLVLCETELLRALGRKVIPRSRYREWERDLQDVELGKVEAVRRIWFVYAKYLH